ncbi:3-deoxy-manno-octulosonate cytidylyltransferase [Agarivorans sp. Toyoura001]|uniref:3-deoxy-manno-octulosonate cytidylyltransferase n=1 Tax=Agarivorans sp. Toyoura001 TaxID=2283141 RepID=UPI0010F3C470|nr:3-deoxy-manno-octulosonate cytidylyltransferase [Agarivorans sp. Toyoura001]GDY25849.1 3-deoxy-manno-octulosonate cytidylyltransferase [Agarivorans sp. Toyoura001]
MKFVVVIPARYQSTRLPAKPLQDIAGKTMIERVYQQACKSGAERVVIATDDQRIVEVANSFNAEVILTADTHESGTERLAEVCERLNFADDTIVVNVQGDEPLIPPAVISQVAGLLDKAPEVKMASLSVPITDDTDIHDPNVVKVVCDKDDHALYFSRSAVPHERDGGWRSELYSRHIGIYAYRCHFVGEYLQLSPSPIEKIEKLEQLRVLWHGYKIKMAQAIETPAHGVDTPEDLEKIRALFN